ncbi:hypothetical protein Tco_1008050 [Tanacetum coccineum]
MSSDSAHSTVSYTSISFEARSWSIPTMDPYEEVAQQGQAAPLSPVYMPDPMELEHHIPMYVPEPDYPDYLALIDDDIPVKDQPLPADASPTTLSLGYVADSDSGEDPIDYIANADDDEDKEEESSEDDDDDEEEHLAPADSTAITSPAVDQVARLLALPTPPPSPLTQLSSPLPHIPSPPLPLPSPPTHTSPTYVEAPLGYRAVGI